MRSRRLFAIVGAFACLGALTTGVDARDGRRGDWERLGCKNVNMRGDRDVIRVGRREGRFEAIRLQARGTTVRLREVTVIYGNGRADELRPQRELRPGESTRSLRLRGRGERGIRRVELRYRARPEFADWAEVCVYGRD